MRGAIKGACAPLRHPARLGDERLFCPEVFLFSYKKEKKKKL